MHKLVWMFLFGILLFLAACGSLSPEVGQNLAVLKGCSACHSVDDTSKIAPPFGALVAYIKSVK